MAALERENLSFKWYICDLEEKLNTSVDTMKTLEGKIDASEAEAFKAFEDIKKEKETLAKKDDELQYLRNMIKNKDSIIAKLETEKKEFNKILKRERNKLMT